MNRFSISTGRNHDGSTNYGINDNMPERGSDGRLSDMRDKDAAFARVDELNARFHTESTIKAREGLEWRWNGRCYSWCLIRVAQESYID